MAEWLDRICSIRVVPERGKPTMKTGRLPRKGGRSMKLSTAVALLTPDRRDHIEAAELRNRCRRGNADTAGGITCTARGIAGASADGSGVG